MMKNLIITLFLSSIILVGCSVDKEATQGASEFEYGYTKEIGKTCGIKLMDEKLLLFKKIVSSNGDSIGKIEFSLVDKSLNLEKLNILELNNLKTSTFSLSPFYDNSNLTGDLSVFNPSEEVGIISNPSKYIDITTEIQNRLGSYNEVGTFSDKTTIINFYERNRDINTITLWDGVKCLKEKTLDEITKEKNTSIDKMVVFEDNIYIISTKNNKLYLISQELNIIDSWNLEDELQGLYQKNQPTSLKFVFQRELNKLFIFKNGSFYDVTSEGIEKFSYGQDDYKEKYILVGSSFYNLYEKQMIKLEGENISTDAVLTNEGDYYFTSSKKFNKKEGEGDKQSKYLVKVKNEELGDFLEVYESK
ncbi:hypothetical protein M9749_001757 [Listeria monocytogenes]|uniref:hypothetical protein n=1 Tax=Listeria monocytogenes TaxID=1639 RepID=UPI0010DCE804|nr:hypothetical protein [Listeria monocytogenes]EAE1301245.1 hypothetical protein [Listeria monocytogenes]EJG4560364.1 hypothetical protein [Listeria monocytogenes]EJG4572476.1 hypothetical protein [Listeria monocytogenes]EJI3954467.1 hypothetical protein [Listeria monocytogenes]